MTSRGRKVAAVLAACAALAVSVLAAAGAQASFGLHDIKVQFTEAPPNAGESGALGTPDTQAGSHPYAMTTSFGVNLGAGEGEAATTDGRIKDAIIGQITGLSGDTTAYPRCSTVDFLTITGGGLNQCPLDTAVGVTGSNAVTPSSWVGSAVFNLVPPPGAVLRLGFRVVNENIVIDVGVNPDPPYNPVARVRNIPEEEYVFGTRFQLWGNPSDPRHDKFRGNCYSETRTVPAGEEWKPLPKKACSVSPHGPFLTLPTRCEGTNLTSFAGDRYEAPGAFLANGEPDLADPNWVTYGVETPSFTGCGKLGLSAGIAAQPTTRSAQSATGLDFSLDVTDEGLKNTAEGATSNSDIRKLVLTLPRGMTANPSLAEGLEVCTEADLARETLNSAPGAGCPEGSKIGTVTAESPIVEEPIQGQIYIAKPYENLAGNGLIGLYMVFKSPQLGVIVKQPTRVDPDPVTGQLIATTEELPQFPLSHVRVHLREGGRSPLISPPGCGSFTTKARMTPWSGGEDVTAESTFTISSGPGEGPCPSGAAPFHPGFAAGTLNNAAGSYSPFYMRITRADGEQDLTKLSQTLPPGLLANLSGIPYCPESGIAKAKSRGGAHGGEAEIADPSCPAASQIGRTEAGAGVGSELTFVPGKLYLAGPYHGDPLSVVSITPAVAGPFDAGAVVVRFALQLNSVTGEAELDGSASDPIPHILQGIPLNVRDLRAYVDRPNFTLNATSCEEEQTRATLWGGGTALAPTGETAIGMLARYQAASCASLGFQPKLNLRLKGGARRGAFPALHAVYTPRQQGDANLKRLALRFPHSEFIEQGHFRTICTRVQFAAGAGHGSECPKGSVYGHIEVWTPLLSEPLSGPVYLRSSNHNLPDAVFALHGIVDLEVALRIDSSHGGLRATVQSSPDAPVSRAIVDMQGGQKGLFVNSTNICRGRHSAQANVEGQNGKRVVLHPLLRAQCKHGRSHRRPRRRS